MVDHRLPADDAEIYRQLGAIHAKLEGGDEARREMSAKLDKILEASSRAAITAAGATQASLDGLRRLEVVEKWRDVVDPIAREMPGVFRKIDGDAATGAAGILKRLADVEGEQTKQKTIAGAYIWLGGLGVTILGGLASLGAWLYANWPLHR